MSSNVAGLIDYFLLVVCSAQWAVFLPHYHREDVEQYARREFPVLIRQIVQFKGGHGRLDVQQFEMGDER
jgi:hypothetical protein